MPAATEINSGLLVDISCCSPLTTLRNSCGLTASSTTPASRTASALLVTVCTPY
jgi:hypothetical protein